MAACCLQQRFVGLVHLRVSDVITTPFHLLTRMWLYFALLVLRGIEVPMRHIRPFFPTVWTRVLLFVLYIVDF